MTDAEQQRIANIEHESHMKGFEVGRDIGRQEERKKCKEELGRLLMVDTADRNHFYDTVYNWLGYKKTTNENE